MRKLLAKIPELLCPALGRYRREGELENSMKIIDCRKKTDRDGDKGLKVHREDAVGVQKQRIKEKKGKGGEIG
jgi:hypothetical protein